MTAISIATLCAVKAEVAGVACLRYTKLSKNLVFQIRYKFVHYVKRKL